MPRILETLARLRDPRCFPLPAATDFQVEANGTLRTLRAALDDPRFTLGAIGAELEARGLKVAISPRTLERDFAWIDANFGGWHAIDLASSEIITFYDANGILAAAGLNTMDRPMPWLCGVRAPGEHLVGPVLVSPRIGAEQPAVRRLLLATALATLRARGEHRALIHGLAAHADLAAYERDGNARLVADFPLTTRLPRRRAALLSSSCADYVAHIHDSARSGLLPIEIAGIVTCAPDEYLTEYAKTLAIPTAVVPWNRAAGETREAFSVRLADALGHLEPDLVALLGWDYLLPPSFIERFPHLVNLHGGYLPLDPAADVMTDPNGRSMPAIRGLRPTHDAFHARLPWSGSTLHRVTSKVDRGEVLMRTPTRLERAKTTDDALILVAASALRTCSAGILRWALEHDAFGRSDHRGAL